MLVCSVCIQKNLQFAEKYIYKNLYKREEVGDIMCNGSLGANIPLERAQEQDLDLVAMTYKVLERD